jgi:hypothetical protein
MVDNVVTAQQRRVVARPRQPPPFNPPSSVWACGKPGRVASADPVTLRVWGTGSGFLASIVVSPYEQRPLCYHAAMSLMPPTPVRLVPGLLRARGLKVSVDRIRDALQRGAVPGHRDDRRRHHWMLTAEDVDAVERYFRELDNTNGGQKAGAAAVEEARRRSR